MAELSRDFSNDQARFEALIFQRSRDVIDGELNDLQRIARVRAYRSSMVLDNDDGRRSGTWGRCRCTNIEIVPGPANDEVTIQPLSKGGASYGLIEYRGYVFEITTAVTLDGLTNVAAGAGSEYRQIYFTLTEVEVSAADDPTILIPELDETARRTRLEVSFFLGAADVDEAGPLNTLAEPWEGGTKACVIGLVNRDDNGGAGRPLPLAGTDIQPLWRPMGTVSRWQDRNAFMGPLNGGVPSYAIWVPSADQLTFFNVGLYMPGQAGTEATPKPVVREMTQDPITILEGQILWLVLDRGRLGLGAVDAGLEYSVSPAWPPAPYRGRLVVLPATEMEDGILDNPDDETVEERYWICFRDNFGTLIFRDGEARGDEDAVETGQVSLKYFGGDHTLDITQIAFNNPSNQNDELPTFRERYVAQSGSMKLLFEARGPDVTSGTQYTRLYAANQLGAQNFTGWILTQNARWETSTDQWEADDSDEPSGAIRIGTRITSGLGHFGFSSRSDSGAATWADDAWPLGSDTAESLISFLLGGTLRGGDFASSVIDSFRRLTLSTTGQPGTTGGMTSNSLYAATVPKAWAHVSVAGGVVVILDAIGLDVAPTVVGTQVSFTLDVAMAGSTYGVQVTGTSDANSYRVQNVSSTVFRVSGATPAGAALDYSADSDSFTVAVFGRHP